MIVTNSTLKRKKFEVELVKGVKKKITIDSKIIEGKSGTDKKVFIMIDEG
jgi:hypothetical protein